MATERGSVKGIVQTRNAPLTPEALAEPEAYLRSRRHTVSKCGGSPRRWADQVPLLMFRKALFWSHLVVGLIAGLIVFVLCLTGALLSFERRSVDWAERSALALPPPGISEPLSADALVAAVASLEPARVTNVRYAADPRMPARLTFANGSVACVNAYTGAVLGRGPTSLVAFYRFVRRAHVALALPGVWAKTGSPVVDAANLAFVFLALGGLILWWPRKWRWRALRNSLAIRFDLRGKPRDWNWHNAFGFWALLPLLFMSISGLVLSYESVDAGMRAFAHRHSSAPVPSVTFPVPETATPKPGWSAILANVKERVPGWRSISIPWSVEQPSWVTINVCEGDEGEAYKRIGVTVDVPTAAVFKVDRWENREAGDRARAVARSGHTGEFGGVAGQAVAALGCLSGVLLVYTGGALSWRRFFGQRRKAPAA